MSQSHTRVPAPTNLMRKQAPCLQGVEHNSRLLEEIYVQLMSYLDAGKKQPSIRGLELLLLTVVTAAPPASIAEKVAALVAAVAKIKVQWPTPAAVLARRIHKTLSEYPAGYRRQLVRAVTSARFLNSNSPSASAHRVRVEGFWIGKGVHRLKNAHKKGE